MCCPPVLILSVGNILFTAEGIGVQAVNHLRDHATLSPGVELLDGGTLGGRLMDAIMSCRRLIVLDAVLGNGKLGDIYRLEGEDLRKSLGFRDSMHQTDLVDTLIFCGLLGTGRKPSSWVWSRPTIGAWARNSALAARPAFPIWRNSPCVKVKDKLEVHE